MQHTFRLLLPALLDDQLIQPQLVCSALLDTVLCDEAEDVHLLRLSNTMSTIHGL